MLTTGSSNSSSSPAVVDVFPRGALAVPRLEVDLLFVLREVGSLGPPGALAALLLLCAVAPMVASPVES